MKTLSRVGYSNSLACCFLASVFFLSLVSSHAQTLLTSWTLQSGTASGLASSSPTMGNGSVVSSTEIYSTFSSVSLAVGDSITFSGSMTLTGNTTSANDQFRFGLFNTNGSSDNTGWLGYWGGNADNVNPGTLRERITGSATDMFASAGSSTVAGASTGVAFTATGSYTLTMAYQRISASSLFITWKLTNGGTYSMTGSYTDSSVSTFTFNSVALLAAGSFNATSISFSNLSINAVPEPQVWSLLGVACVSFLIFRKRKVGAAI